MRITSFLSEIFFKPSPILWELEEINTDKTWYYREELHPCFLDGVYVSLRYNIPLQKKLERFKYYFEKEWAKDFLLYLENTFVDHVQINEPFIITGVPSFFLRSLFQKENHSEYMGKFLAKKTNQPFKKLLFKPNPTKKQARLGREERIKNLTNAFRVPKKLISSIRGKSILLIDDVISTGTTANEAARALKTAGAKKVYGLFVATGK